MSKRDCTLQIVFTIKKHINCRWRRIITLSFKWCVCWIKGGKKVFYFKQVTHLQESTGESHRFGWRTCQHTTLDINFKHNFEGNKSTFYIIYLHKWISLKHELSIYPQMFKIYYFKIQFLSKSQEKFSDLKKHGLFLSFILIRHSPIRKCFFPTIKTEVSAPGFSHARKDMLRAN